MEESQGQGLGGEGQNGDRDFPAVNPTREYPSGGYRWCRSVELRLSSNSFILSLFLKIGLGSCHKVPFQV